MGRGAILVYRDHVVIFSAAEQAKLFDVRPARRAYCRVRVAIVDRLAARITHYLHDLLPALLCREISRLARDSNDAFLLRRRCKGHTRCLYLDRPRTHRRQLVPLVPKVAEQDGERETRPHDCLGDRPVEWLVEAGQPENEPHFEEHQRDCIAGLGESLAYRCRPAYVQRHVHIQPVRADRLFGGGQKQALASEPLKVGDLSSWEPQWSSPR
jgi:hypothetical protein